MPAHRMNREQFFAKLAHLDEGGLQKVLWTLYWRGSGPVRERIEALLEPEEHRQHEGRDQRAVDPESVLAQVRNFVELARSGSYLAGDRRVSPKERSHWRTTFRGLATDAQDTLRADRPESGARALELIIDFACETKGYDYFRSEDPMRAAGFVVSDAVTLLWTSLRDRRGFPEFVASAPAQLIRWEAPFGWTRRGDGSVAEKESSLAEVLAGMLHAPDHWSGFAARYLEALDELADGGGGRTRTVGAAPDRRRTDRARTLAQWHGMLLDRLADSESEHLLDRLVVHPALSGPELRFVEAGLAARRDDHERAQELVYECLERLPGHPGFHDFAHRIEAPLPPRAQQLATQRP